MSNVLVLGLGETGGPLFEILQETYNVFGKDIEPVSVAVPIDVMHICYPFQNSEQFIRLTAGYAAEFNPRLIVIHSTIVPRTTLKVAERTRCLVAYSPIRGKHTRMREDMLKYTKYVAGITSEAAEEASTHLRQAGLKIKVMDSPETLELAKLVETSYLGLLVGWAQEVERYARALDSDYYEVMSFLEEIDYLPPVIFRPGHIGGHCVIPNLELLSQVMPGEFVEAIKRSNEMKARDLQRNGAVSFTRLTPIRVRS